MIVFVLCMVVRSLVSIGKRDCNIAVRRNLLLLQWYGIVSVCMFTYTYNRRQSAKIFFSKSKITSTTRGHNIEKKYGELLADVESKRKRTVSHTYRQFVTHSRTHFAQRLKSRNNIGSHHSSCNTHLRNHT